MTLPSGGSRPLGQDPTAAFATAPQGVPHDVPQGLPVGRDTPPRGYAPQPVHPVPVTPVAAAPVAGAVPITPGDDREDRRRRKAPLAWLPWALLAALLGLLALMLLAGTLAGAERAASRTASGAGTGATDSGATGSGAAGSGAAGGGAGAAAPAGAGILTAGDVDLLANEQNLGRLASLQGQPAVGRGVLVESVVADEGFWVGSSPSQRTFVFLSPEARQSADESGYQVKQGQRVDLNGTVTSISQGDAERFGVTGAEGARQLTQQKAYVRATQVRLTES